jgi:hypothetical protein
MRSVTYGRFDQAGVYDALSKHAAGQQQGAAQEARRSDTRRGVAVEWLAALDDFRNWLQLGLPAREKA